MICERSIIALCLIRLLVFLNAVSARPNRAFLQGTGCLLVMATVWHLFTCRVLASAAVMDGGGALCQTKVCTGVMERVGEPALSDEEEAERLVTSRCNSSTLFCNSARFANSSL